ncbi:ArsR/SmtB family transcription factor [Lysobacter gummosus]|uniref:ArsR/SmtB family transcription factor n=1 Tax=Lysobacter gummosus TaxID=262324 RepID=UPI0036433505
MRTEHALADIAAAIGDPARALMLVALLDGRSRSAGELAAAAGVAPQTASTHLARLGAAALIATEKQGGTAITGSPPAKSPRQSKPCSA